jgi:hypothetical protein
MMSTGIVHCTGCDANSAARGLDGWVCAGSYRKLSMVYWLFLCPNCAPDVERHRALVALREGVEVSRPPPHREQPSRWLLAAIHDGTVLVV